MTNDPLGDFFREIHHRLDLFPQVVPVGHAWPTISTHDLYKVWLRDSQQRRELRIREEQLKALRGEVASLRAQVADGPPTWTAPVSGRYHFVSGRELHLVENCTEECAT